MRIFFGRLTGHRPESSVRYLSHISFSRTWTWETQETLTWIWLLDKSKAIINALCYVFFFPNFQLTQHLFSQLLLQLPHVSNWHPSFLCVTRRPLLDKFREASWHIQICFNFWFTNYLGAYRIQMVVSGWPSWLVRVVVLVPVTVFLERAKAELFSVLEAEAPHCRGDISLASCTLSHSSSNPFEDKRCTGNRIVWLLVLSNQKSGFSNCLWCHELWLECFLVCWNGCSFSVRLRFLGGLLEPTDAGAVVVIWFKLLVEKLAIRLSSFPALIATAIQWWQMLFLLKYMHVLEDLPLLANWTM